MTYWKCSCCGKVKETKEDIIMVICGLCQEALEPYPEYKYQVVTEVKR